MSPQTHLAGSRWSSRLAFNTWLQERGRTPGACAGDWQNPPGSARGPGWWWSSAAIPRVKVRRIWPSCDWRPTLDTAGPYHTPGGLPRLGLAALLGGVPSQGLEDCFTALLSGPCQSTGFVVQTDFSPVFPMVWSWASYHTFGGLSFLLSKITTEMKFDKKSKRGEKKEGAIAGFWDDAIAGHHSNLFPLQQSASLKMENPSCSCGLMWEGCVSC